MCRHLRLSLAILFGLLAARPILTAENSTLDRQISPLEIHLANRIGIVAMDTESGQMAAYRADERFSMASTFKAALAAAVLARVDAGTEDLARIVRYDESDLLSYAPAARAGLTSTGGRLSVGELCAAAVQLSDNTAANLLLESLGGPAGFTAFLRTIGDETTRLDRNEPTLNSNLPGDPRDTTTPFAMAATLRTLLLGDALSPASRAQFAAWLKGTPTGANRIKAALPSDWFLGHKTGTGENGATNDIGIVWPPDHAPIIIAVYFDGSVLPLPDQEAALAAATRHALAALLAPAAP